MNCVYRYTFTRQVPAAEIESTLVLAFLAIEGLHCASEARLDAGHAFDARRRHCVLDAGTPVGRDLCRIFTGFASREFGDDNFRVERIDRPAPTEPAKRPVPKPAEC
jgi:hypothetical protein